MIRSLLVSPFGVTACVADVCQFACDLERVVGEVERSAFMISNADVEPVSLRVVQEKPLHLTWVAVAHGFVTYRRESAHGQGYATERL